MELNSFTIWDQVLEKGQVRIREDKCLITPKEVYEGKIVVRRENPEYCVLYTNRVLEWEINRINNSDLTNKRRRIYQTLGTREPYVVERMLERIKEGEEVAIKDDLLWVELLKEGKYMENVTDVSLALDLSIYDGILEYDCQGYYSPHMEWIKKIKKNIQLSTSKIQETIKCRDESLIERWLISLGYTKEGRKYILPIMERKDIFFSG